MNKNPRENVDVSNLYKFPIVAVFILIGLSLNSFGQVTISNFDFNAAASYPVSATSTAVNVTANATSTEPFGTGNGTATDANAFVANATAGNGLEMANSSGTNTRYFQFTLGGSSLSFYKNYRVYVQARRNPQGAQTITLAYSIDCTNFTNFSPPLSSGNASYNSVIYDLSAISAINNQSVVCFRLLASQAGGTGTLRIDNFQVEANLAPTAASGTISGRARMANGSGVKHAVVMLSGGNLPEPLYATTNQFGIYQFQDITVGDTYVLQIMSGRYTFQNPSIVVNLDDSIIDADFYIDEPAIDTKRVENLKGILMQRDERKKP